MSDTDATPTPSGVYDQFLDSSRVALERSLAAYETALDGWASAAEGRSADRPRAATPTRAFAWWQTVWVEALENALVHLDDAVTEDGVDLDRLEMIWLHAVDDAVTDVGKTPEFGATLTETVEDALAARAEAVELGRTALRENGFATDRDVETAGKHLLALEARQKAVEDGVRAVLDALDVPPDPPLRGEARARRDER